MNGLTNTRKTLWLLGALAVLLPAMPGPVFGAIPAGTVWETRTDGAQTNGAGFVWTSLVDGATYTWTASGSGTNEYYCEAFAGGDPSLTASGSVMLDGNFNLATEGTAGSLTAGQYDWADNDTLGYTTLYVRLANGLDPDTMIGRGQPGYVAYGAGGTDYSQQAAAELELTDLASDGAGTTITSATGGFTAAMKNNIIRIESTGSFTAGWYHIVSVSDTNTIVIDRSAGAGKTGGAGKVGGAFAFGASLDDDFGEASVAGNTCWIASGTHTLGETVTWGAAGTTSNFIRFIGYNESRGDNPLGDNRPLIDAGATVFGITGDRRSNSHFRVTGTGSTVLHVASGWHMNLKATNTETLAGHSAMYVPISYTYVIACEASCANTESATKAFSCGTAQSIRFVGCYAHDCGTGFDLGNNFAVLMNCVADTCAVYGVYADSYDVVANCTISTCGTGIYSAGETTNCFVNNIITDCTTGIAETATLETNGVLYNCLNNTTDISHLTLVWGNLFADPLLKDPGNGDFRLDSGSPALSAGVDVGSFTTAITYDED